LAGRIAFIHLLPFSYKELQTGKHSSISLNKLILNGGYPRLYDKKIKPVDYYPNYLLTYVERDVRQIKNISNLAIFQRFLKVCASRVGQEVNYTSIGNDTGVDQKTILSWFGILEASFIAFRLQPFYNNLGKRLTQMPKLYFYDTGLCCSLLEFESESHVNTHPLRGALFENLIILELLKSRFNNGQRSNLFYWRDRTGNEIDVLMEQSSQVVPVEIKSAATFTNDFLKGIKYWKKINPDIKNSYVVFTGQSSSTDFTDILNWKEIDKIKN
ncbi:MAG: ATP-binding protein, partial [Bacteroidia bacterium]